MNKNIKRTLSIILSLLMVLSCCATAFAATKETVYQYGKEGGYLAIGDSISRGCGADGFYIGPNGEYQPEGEGQYGDYSIRNVEGCVPYQIAQAVGCTAPATMAAPEDDDSTYWPFAFPGMTTAVTLDLLGVEDNFTDTKLNYSYYKDMLEYFGYEGSFVGAKGETYDPATCGKCGNIIDFIKRADLITVQLGMCDIFYRAYRIISNGGMLADGLQFDLSSTDAIKSLVETAITEIYNGYNYWKENYPLVIEKIQELNPDATIVIVGAFNLINQLTITDDLIAPLGSVITAITGAMNVHFSDWAKKYNVKYADISNTETQATENDWSLLGDFKDHSFTGTHPTQKGYDYIVRQILAELPPEDDSKEIKVDLGRFDKVDYVMVNGIKVSNYTLDGFMLTIPYSGPGATNLTIGVKNDDGTVSVQTYTLTYSISEGYTAYRVYGNNDIEGTVKKPFQNIIKLLKDFFQKIIDGIKNLFNKG